MKPHLRPCWVIPPEHSGECVAHMEQVLELYHLPYHPQMPLVCMDEQPVQLIKETRPPLPAAPGKPAKVDYEFGSYAGAVHSFTNPGADAYGVPGIKHDAKADSRSWRAMLDLFKESFGGQAKRS